MKEDKNIEELLKEQLNQEFEFNDSDIDELSGILDDFNEEPKRKKGAFFIIAGLILLVTIIGSIFVINKSIKNNIPLKTTNLIDENNQTLNEGNFIEDCSGELENKNNNSTNSSSIQNEYTEKAESTIAKKSNYQQNKNGKVPNKTFKQNNIKTLKIRTKKVFNKTKGKLIKKVLISNKTIETQSNNTSSENIQKNVIVNPESLIEVETKNTELIKENTIEVSSNTITSKGFENTVNTDSTEEIKEPIIEIDSINEKSVIAIQTSVKKDLGISIALRAGPSFIFREFNSDILKRNDEESNKLISWNASLDFTKTFKNKFIIGTGISLINYGEKINYSSINYIQKDTTYRYEENTYGLYTYSKRNGIFKIDTSRIKLQDTILLITEKTITDKSTTKENGSTNFSYIEIPFQIGYNIFKTKKFSLNAMTGASVGVLSQRKGFFINNENVLYKAESKEIIFNYLLSLDFNYEIIDNVSLSISPHFKYNLDNLSPLKGIKRKYSTFGINGGIVIDF